LRRLLSATSVFWWVVPVLFLIGRETLSWQHQFLRLGESTSGGELYGVVFYGGLAVWYFVLVPVAFALVLLPVLLIQFVHVDLAPSRLSRLRFWPRSWIALRNSGSSRLSTIAIFLKAGWNTSFGKKRTRPLPLGWMVPYLATYLLGIWSCKLAEPTYKAVSTNVTVLQDPRLPTNEFRQVITQGIPASFFYSALVFSATVGLLWITLKQSRSAFHHFLGLMLYIAPVIWLFTRVPPAMGFALADQNVPLVEFNSQQKLDQRTLIDPDDKLVTATKAYLLGQATDLDVFLIISKNVRVKPCRVDRKIVKVRKDQVLSYRIIEEVDIFKEILCSTK
jgi:hypothetical protein